MKKLLGYSLIGLPLAILYAFITYYAGWRVALSIFVITVVLHYVVWLGVNLID